MQERLIVFIFCHTSCFVFFSCGIYLFSHVSCLFFSFAVEKGRKELVSLTVHGFWLIVVADNQSAFTLASFLIYLSPSRFSIPSPPSPSFISSTSILTLIYLPSSFSYSCYPFHSSPFYPSFTSPLSPPS